MKRRDLARRDLARKSGSRRLERKIFVAAEGAVTEKDYLYFLRDLGCDKLHFIRSPDGKSAPRQVLKRMKNELKGLVLLQDDEFWLLVDRDEWDPNDIQALFEWQKADARRHVVVSNPCVEFWLLLHFEDGEGATTAEICRNRLKQKKRWPDYDKSIPPGGLTESLIQDAMARAERVCAEKSWTEPGGTTFHLLVRSLLNSKS